MTTANLSMHFVSPSKITLGYDFTCGVLHKETGDEEFQEHIIGFFFFYFSLLITKPGN
jgi:hypothetical protein